MLSHRTQPVLRSIALTVDFCLKDADDETAVSTSKTSCAIVLPAVWHSPSERARHSSNSLAASAASTILFFWLGRGRQGNLRHCQSPRLPCLSRLLTSSQRIFERLHRFLDSVSAPQLERSIIIEHAAQSLRLPVLMQLPAGPVEIRGLEL